MESSDTWTQLAAAWTAVSLGRRELLSGLPAEPERPVEEIANESAVKRGDSGMGIQDQPLTSMEKIMFLKESSFFAALPLEELYHIALSIQEESAKEGAVVIKQGTRGDKMYIVVEGKLEVSRSDPDVKGESQRITVLGENQVFGDMALLDDEPRSASVIALEDCKLLSLQRSDLERILRRYSSIAFNMMRILSSRLRDSMAA
jgi:signal-transduction protein with cAMP-binding, CBS, and nucleotidyltransferase domain